MKLHKVMAIAVVSLSAFALGACGGGSEGVTGPTSSRYPSVGGNWRGEWSSSSSVAPVTLSLSQNEGQVRGTLTVGSLESEITGTISEFGVLEFAGRSTDTGRGCIAYYSNRPHLALSERNSEMGGPVEQASSVCGGSRVLRRGGVMELDKVL